MKQNDTDKKTMNSAGKSTSKEMMHHELNGLKASILKLVFSFRELRNPLDRTFAAMPEATSHLDMVSEQTEAAANRVLDLAEQIVAQQSEMVKLLNVALNELEDKVKAPKVVEAIEQAEAIANKCQNNTYTIMEALQFQDITSQQINHAASLLEDVELRMNELIGVLDGEVAPLKGEEKKERAFDPHAHMTIKHTSQQSIDDLIRTSHEKE